MMDSGLHLVELITRELSSSEVVGTNPAEVVEAIRIDHGPRIELPMDSHIAIEYEAGASTPMVTITILAGRVRYLDRRSVL